MKRILIVDDMPASRKLLVTFLGEEFEVVEAADGIECLDRVEKDRPDIVLLDLSLPGMDGIEVIRRIRAHPHAGTTPIFALTAHTLKEYEDRACEAGCNEYLVKPFDLDELRDLVLAAIEPQAGG